jgi:tetratricopeptide (TPR) repeat protein
MKNYRRTAVILLCACMMAGCQSSDGAPTSVETGMQQLQEENYQEALDSFEQSINEKKDLLQAYRGAGIADMGLGDYEMAIDAFEAALGETKDAMKETRKDILYYEATSYYRLEKYDETISVCQEILDIEQEGDAFYLTGACYLAKGDEDAAQTNFDAAVAASPDDYDLYLDIYESYEEQKLSAEGDTYLQMALQRENTDDKDAYQKAKIYYYLEDYDNAKEQLSTLVEAGDGDSMLLMGQVFLALEEPARAQNLFQQYITEIQETPEAYNGLVLAKIAQEDYDGALSAAAQGLALEQEAGKQDLYYNEIVACEYKGDFDTAKKKAQAYVEKYPTDEMGQKEYEFLSTR